MKTPDDGAIDVGYGREVAVEPGENGVYDVVLRDRESKERSDVLEICVDADEAERSMHIFVEKVRSGDELYQSDDQIAEGNDDD
jgi:hypothetical protein